MCRVENGVRVEERVVEVDAGRRSAARIWVGPRSRAKLLLLHGMGQYGGRFDALARHLASIGVTVTAYDQRGHGRGPGRTGWLGDFDQLLDDLQTVVEQAAREQPELPLLLMGHSMGGLVVLAYLLDRRPLPDMAVLSSPAIVPLIDDEDGLDPTRLSRDPAAWRSYMRDPLLLRERVQPELYHRLFDGLCRLPGRAAELSLPLLLVQGSDDRLCSSEGAVEYLEQASSADLDLRVYEGGRHELFADTIRERVSAELGEWILERVPRNSASMVSE